MAKGFVAGVFFFQAEDGIRDLYVTGVQTCALPISWTKCKSAITSIPSGFSSRACPMGVRSVMKSALPGLSVLVDRKSTRLNSSHVEISYAVFCLKKKKQMNTLHCHPDHKRDDVLVV